MINEDAPTNNVGSGTIAGTGIGPMGEPGVSKKAQRKRQSNEKSTPNPIVMRMLRRKVPMMEEFDTFAGSVVFEVSSKVFHMARNEKRKGKHWRKYLDEDDCFADIREYAHKNPGRGIVLRNENTGEMCYARYPKKRG